MAVVHINADLLEIDGKVRIERGPKTLTATATKELLDNSKTKEHYQVGSMDALGKVIVLGEPMVYHDWLGFEQGVSEGFHLYKLDDDGIWQKIGIRDSQAAAVAEGVNLLSVESV